MEIRDWIRAIGARVALIAVVAGLAGLLAATLALFQPQRHRATATTALPDVPTAGPLTSAVGQRVANFQGAVESDGVLDAVADETGVPRDSLGTVSSERVGQSNVMEVRFIGTDPDRAREVVVAASQQALLMQAEFDLVFAESEVGTAKAALDEAVVALETRSQETGIVAPDITLASLGRRYIQAQRAGDPGRAETLQEQIGLAQEVQQLRNSADAALSTWSVAQERLRQAQGRIAAASNVEPRVGDIVPVSKFGTVARQAAYATLFGAALAIGFVIVIELLRSGTGASRPSLPRPTRQRTRAGAF